MKPETIVTAPIDLVAQNTELAERNEALTKKYNELVERCNYAERAFRELKESKTADTDLARVQLINERDFLRDSLAGVLGRVDKLRKLELPDSYRYR